MKSIVTILLFIISFSILAQTSYNTFSHEDEWLQPDVGQTAKDFIKIKIAKEGIHRLSYSDLISKGFTFSNENEIQLFRRGIEQAIFIEGNGDGFNAANDFIEFYGNKNDGELDGELYFPKSLQPHKFHNLFTDSAAYFLTSRSGVVGKRVQNLTSNSTNFEPYFINSNLDLFTSNYSKGRAVANDNIWTPFYAEGEGWFSQNRSNGQSLVVNFQNISGVVNATNPSHTPYVEVLYVGNKSEPVQSVNVSTSTDGSIFSNVTPVTSSSWNSKKIIIPLSFSDLNGTTNFYVKTEVTGANSRIRLGYVKLVFPKQLNSIDSDEGVIEFVDKTIGQSSDIDLSSLNTNNVVYQIRDNGNHARSNNLNAISINHLQNNSKLYFVNDGFQTQIQSSQIEKVEISIPKLDEQFVILTHSLLEQGANSYKNFRESAIGGKYRAGVNLINNIYNVFSYGDLNPVAIRRYCDYLITNNSDAKYLFIIGKGLAIKDNYGSYRDNPVSYTRNGYSVDNVNFVPPVGTPGSDVFFSSHIVDDSTWVPEIPTGRITAISNAEVEDYLDKIIEYETSPDAAWKKRLLHLGGGSNTSQINSFKSYLNGWKNIAEGNYFGAEVSSLFKTQTGLQNISVSDEVNEGLRLITFFGHSTTNQSDIDIGRVSDISKGYNNTDGKFPIIILNGCQSGNFYDNNTGFGEDWVVTAKKGAIAFISSSTTAYANYLYDYTNNFYNVAFRDTNYLDTTLGYIIKRVNQRLNYQSSTSIPTLGHSMNINILGDPAVRVFSNSKPDLETNNNAVFLEPIGEEVVTAVSDTFNVGIIVRNFGKFDVKDSFFISLQRTYNGQTVNYPPKMYNAVANTDTLYYGISSPSLSTYGLNNFTITIDYNSTYNSKRVNEYNETNNVAIFQQVIPLSGVFPLFPKEFEILSYSTQNEYNRPWVLQAQSTNLLVDDRDYIIEIDTSNLFLDGGFKRSKVINSGAQVSWDATSTIDDMLLSISNSLNQNPDSVVFYWRVKFNTLLPGEQDLWGYSSFMYIYQSPGGWAQGHLYQFLKDDFNYLRLDSNSREWEFLDEKTVIRYSTTGPSGIPSSQNPALPTLKQDFIVPGYIYSSSSQFERGRGLLVNIYDDKTLVQDASFSSITGARANGRYYYFRLDIEAHVNSFVDLILNQVEIGNYVAVLTKDVTTYSSWPQLDAAFAEIGAQNFPPSDTIGYAIMGRKQGTALFEKYIFGANSFDTSITLTSNLDFGEVNSTVIGPVTEWNKLYRNVKKEDMDDTWGIDVYALNNTQDKDTLYYSNLTQEGFDLNIDSDSFPYIRLVMNKEDLTLKTPPQMKNWLVTYKAEIPEGIIIATKDIENYGEVEFYEGDSRVYNFRFKNISRHEFKDSLWVLASIVSTEGVTANTIRFKIKKPSPNEYVDFQYQLETINLDGDYNLQVTVNPNIEVEHYYHNNSLTVPFKVIADNIHPILDVTFDGSHIMDFDIVSPITEISIRMKDENKFLLVKDRDNFEFEVRKGDREGPLMLMKDIAFDTSSSKNSQVELRIKPQRALEDGEYFLFAQVYDEKGNKSGTKGYEIHFTVVNKTTITNFYPYPNPFSTSMRFAYTLTGSQQPDEMKIQIMTISGKIVREITQFELGPLKIGKHLTDFVWDGTDEFGSRLANGVYLYRVIANLDNEKIESRVAGSKYKYLSENDENGNTNKSYYGSSKADELFKKGWGKLYIMR